MLLTQWTDTYIQMGSVHIRGTNVLQPRTLLNKMDDSLLPFLEMISVRSAAHAPTQCNATALRYQAETPEKMG